MSKVQKKQTLWLASAVAWAALIFALSQQPASSYEGAGNFLDFIPGLSFMVHGGLYFVLASLIFATLASFTTERMWILSAGVVSLAALYGVSDEWHQTFIEGRSASGLDVLADTLGAVSAVTLWLVAGRILSARRRAHIDHEQN